MNIYFRDRSNGEKFESDETVTYDEALKFLDRLKTPNSTLILQVPSGLGLDFEVQANGLLTVKFYGDDLSNASVTPSVAKQIVSRALEGRHGRTKDIFSDLISIWSF